MKMSNYVKEALEAVASDAYPWVEFTFVPCPVGGDTLPECKSNPGPFAMPPDCCVHDKFEACLMSTISCYPMSAGCTFARQVQLSQFLSCFEGGGPFQDGVCKANAETCATTANFTDEYNAIMTCVNNANTVGPISRALNATCTAEPSINNGWPHVRVNGILTCGDDSCMMPLLQVLCNAYPLDTKPTSCNQSPFPPASKVHQGTLF